MNIPELTEVVLAMSHASVLLLSVCSFTSEAFQLDFTSHPLCFCIKMLGTKGGGGFQSKALLPLYETLNELVRHAPS